MWHSILCHDSSYVWDLVPAHLVIMFAPGFGPLKSGCDRSGIRGMLTVRRNLDRTGQPLSYLPLLLWFFSKLFLIYSHLFPLYSELILSFLSKIKKWISHSEILCLKWPLGIGDLILGTKKNKTIFIVIYALECLFLWYLSDLDLWLSVMGCGVMSIITSTYAYIKIIYSDKLGYPSLKDLS
jgi:hypothetical protein